MTRHDGPPHTLALEPQHAAERLAVRIVNRPDVKQARQAARDLLLDDPVAMTPDGRRRLDTALDQWTMALAMRSLADDTFRPFLLWICDNNGRTWGGHTMPGSAILLDSPDNINRSATLDGDGEYVIHGRFGSTRNLFTLQIIVDPPCHAGNVIGGTRSLAVLTGRDIVADEDGAFTVTIDRHAAGERPNHMQSESGPVWLISRDGLSDWRATPTALSIRRSDATPPLPPPTEEEIGRAVARCLVPWVSHWNGFRRSFIGSLAANSLGGPSPRDGGWGYVAQGHFDLRDDEALVITTTDGGSEYANLQLADPWGVMPDVVGHTSSYNKSQVAKDPEGAVTYVVSVKDPGVANWVDTAGFHTGTLLFRWQSVPSGTDGSGFVTQQKLVRLEDLETALPKGTPKADAAQRRRQIAQRASDREFILRS